jgi:hypothetical protein
MIRSMPLTLTFLSTAIIVLPVSGVAGEPSLKGKLAARPARISLNVDAWGLACSRDGKILATVVEAPRGDRVIQVRDLTTANIIGQGDAGRTIGFPVFSADGKELALVFAGGMFSGPPLWICLWDVPASGDLKSLRHLHPDLPYRHCVVEHASFSPDGKTLVAGTPQEVLFLWDTSTGQIKRRFQGGVAASFFPDGKTLVAVTHDGQVRRFDFPSCKLIGPERARTNYVYVTRVVFSRDGKLVALGDDWTTVIKEVATGRTVCQARLPTATIPRSFSSGGTTLAVTGDDGVHFIDTTTGRERAWLAGSYRAVEFLGDSEHLACLADKAIVQRETAAVYANAENASEPNRTVPPGVPLQAELIVKQDKYILDLQGDTPAECSDRIQFDADYVDGYPRPPKVDLVLRLRNTAKKKLTLRLPAPSWVGDRECDYRPTLYLVGEGAINFPRLPHQTVAIPIHPGPQLRTLAPDESLSIPIADLHSAVQAFWLLPGEYAIAGYYDLEVSPAPPGSHDASDGFGYVTVRLAPVKVNVVAGKNDTLPRRTKPPLGAHNPPAPGTVITPNPVKKE